MVNPLSATPSLANLEAEAVLLGGLLIDNRQIEAVGDRLAAPDFYEPLHGRIFEAITRESAFGHTVSPITLRPYFEGDPAMQSLGGLSYLARLTSDGQGLYSLPTLVQQIADLSRRRKLHAALATAAEACADMEQALPDIVANADAALTLPDASREARELTAQEALFEMRQNAKASSVGIICGSIPNADATLGSLRAGQLIVIAARPAMGKTAFALSYATGAAKQGNGVLFVSLEMSAEDLAERLASDLSYGADGRDALPYSVVRSGRLNDRQRCRLAEIDHEASRLPLYVTDPAHMRIGQLDRCIRRFSRRMAANDQRLDLVIVDYLQLLQPDTKGRSEYEAISEVSRMLKALAKRHGVAIMALAQLSREVEKRPDKRPQLADLRGSGQIEQDADIIAFLLRQEYYLRQAEPDLGTSERLAWEEALDAVSGLLELIVAKKRAGVTGSAFCRFEGAFQAVRGAA
ncbi:replicative DNA helicase [Novosphingobium umbonatum]|nr:DnaB-like helicase C-terminal domain-containing protein [Novosphingobium umbonatum]